MSGVFLSYRRQDSDYAVLLYAWLAQRFGPEEVFWDREDIDPGKDFRRVLSQHLGGCEALVALIGPGWSPSEWIRREIGAALRRKVLVVPVLVGEAQALQSAALPKSIRKLAVLQALETRDLRFRARLMEVLDPVVPASGPAVTNEDLRTRRLAELLQQQTDHRQGEGLALLMAGKTEQALDVLDETFTLLMTLLDLRPGDPELETRLGFLYKDMAQAFEGSDRVRFDRYVQSGLQLFEGLVARKLGADVLAGAWNGLGNMHFLLGDFKRAVECSRRAVTILPGYAYAWGDLFLAYDGLAEHGEIDLVGLRQAVQQMKATGTEQPLVTSCVAEYESHLRKWERRARSQPRHRRSPSPAPTKP
jgi:tetratricopeptide (TPR) repeat protein